MVASGTAFFLRLRVFFAGGPADAAVPSPAAEGSPGAGLFRPRAWEADSA